MIMTIMIMTIILTDTRHNDNNNGGNNHESSGNSLWDGNITMIWNWYTTYAMWCTKFKWNFMCFFVWIEIWFDVFEHHI